MLTHRLKLPSQGSGNASPPAGWQQRTHTAPVPDVAVGATNEAAVTLQTEAQSWSQKPHSFPIVRASVPATPGAPPEVFVEAKMELWAAIRACLTLELRAQGKTILTDFMVGGSVICKIFLQMSVYLTVPLV